MSVVGVFVIKQGIKEHKEAKLLQAEGKLVTGKVVKQETRKKKRGYNYYLHVEFQTEKGQVVYKRLSVNEDRFDRHGPSDPIRLIYAPSNPSIVTDKEVKPSYSTVMLGAAFLLVGVGGLAWKLRFLFLHRKDSSIAGASQENSTQTLRT